MSWFTLLPPLVAIVVAIWKKDVILSLMAALLVAHLLLQDFNPFLGLLNALTGISAVFQSADNTKILLFSLVIGALLNIIKRSGGVAAFVAWVTRVGFADNRRKVAGLPALLGLLIFIETNLSILTAGFIARDLFDQVKMSRARLAYIIDSTCAPVCVILMFNAWGATILGLISDYDLASPVSTLVRSVGYNFYSWLTLLLVFYTVWSSRVFGPMKQSELNQSLIKADTSDSEGATHISLMLVPLLALIAGIIGFMAYTGQGESLKGDGATSVFWAVCLSTALAMLMARLSSRPIKINQQVQWCFEGMASLLPLVTTVLLALALGSAMKALGTGQFVSQMVSDSLPLWSLPALIFIAGAIMSFTTGTSWGTFSILIPIGIPVALTTGLPAELLLAAILSGSIFGDHCSPISDTTIVSSLAAGCDHLEHVKTQLPYALAAGVMSIAGFVGVGLWFG